MVLCRPFWLWSADRESENLCVKGEYGVSARRRRRKRNPVAVALGWVLLTVVEGIQKIGGVWKKPGFTGGKLAFSLVIMLALGGIGTGVYLHLKPVESLPVEAPPEEILDLPDPSVPDLPAEPEEPEEPVDDGSPRPDPESQIDFAALREQLAAAKAQNDEAVAWLYIPGTTVSHPVFLTDDNSFYLDHNAVKAYDPYGIPFLDYRNTAGLRAGDFSTNSIIYAHNKADHRLFGQLLDTYLDADSARDSCYIYLATEGEVMIFKVFAGFYTNGSSYGEEVFNYRQISPEGEALTKLVEDAKARSWVKYGVDVEEGDQLITLSTCGYRYRYASTGGYIDVTRFGVMARLLRKGETDSDPVILYNNRSPIEPTFRNAYYASTTAR